MITPSYLGETIEYSSLHACRSTLEDPTLGVNLDRQLEEITKFRQEVANLDEALARPRTPFVQFDQEVARIDLRPLQVKSHRLANAMDKYPTHTSQEP